MEATDDSALLRKYAENQSEEAFAALVTRHINLVYSVALRHVGNRIHAEEITQAVFIILAQKALRLRYDRALSSWLFQATRLTAANFVRSEARRQRREQEAYMQNILNDPGGDNLWPGIAPMLDSAVAALSEQDRRAIVLRFYEGRNLSEVGAAMGVSEEATKKRVARALEKLQRYFFKRGVDSTTAAIAETISANSIQAAPMALAKSVTAAAVAKGAVASCSTLTLIKATLLAMKTKTIVVTVVATAIVIGAGALLIHKSKANHNESSSPVDKVPISIDNAEFAPDGDRDGTFLVEVDPNTRRTTNSTPAVHIAGPIASALPGVDQNTPGPNGTYKKTDNSSSTRYYVDKNSSLYGKHIRLTGWLKTTNVQGWASAFMIIVGEDMRHYQYDDMSDRPIRGSTDWQQIELVTDLPDKPCVIYFGPDLYGPGELWGDDFKIDLAPADEANTDDRNWRITGESDPTVYSESTDFSVTHDGNPTACFVYTPGGTAPRGAHARWGQNYYGPASDKYAGHTVRLSGWIKTANVSGRIEPVIYPYTGWYKLLARDSMVRDDSLKGTRDWTQFSVTCAVPKDTLYLCTGFNLFGSGKAWIDMSSVKLEIIK